METPRIYIETTIPSFYYTERTDADAIARRQWTRDWWQRAVTESEMVTSANVIRELERGAHLDSVAQRLELIKDLPILPIDESISEIVQVYLQHRLMPSDPLGDAFHLAIASVYKCDFLVTWNCSHLANANKFGHIRRINVMLDLFVPTLVTPLGLLNEELPDENEPTS